ncbi:unnamed protein product [Protopolystoma xenopodis]|uniref:Uncharacterized protein n=1 Tax=Protopolystoma xenopodis TaxID=117903 RepID=A0A3S5BU91_9PLAT|nr:unnamed protein product [Protopolystoma xenopodis]
MNVIWWNRLRISSSNTFTRNGSKPNNNETRDCSKPNFSSHRIGLNRVAERCTEDPFSQIYNQGNPFMAAGGTNLRIPSNRLFTNEIKVIRISTMGHISQPGWSRLPFQPRLCLINTLNAGLEP